MKELVELANSICVIIGNSKENPRSLVALRNRILTVMSILVAVDNFQKSPVPQRRYFSWNTTSAEPVKWDYFIAKLKMLFDEIKVFF